MQLCKGGTLAGQQSPAIGHDGEAKGEGEKKAMGVDKYGNATDLRWSFNTYSSSGQLKGCARR